MNKKIGIVEAFGSRGFGFLRPETTDSQNSKRLFFHIADVLGHVELRAGDRVEYQETISPKGLRAIQVNPLQSAEPRQ